jgi:hypothetical protein
MAVGIAVNLAWHLYRVCSRAIWWWTCTSRSINSNTF